MTEHYLDASMAHAFWDKSYPPRIEIHSGDTVVFECREASDNQVTAKSGHEALANLDFSRINPLTGPVFVNGAEPGDTLEAEILKFEDQRDCGCAQLDRVLLHAVERFEGIGLGAARMKEEA